MIPCRSRWLAAGLAVFSPITGAAAATCTSGSAVSFCDVEDIPAPTTAVQLAYAPARRVLAVRNAGSMVAVIDLSTFQTSVRPATHQFTDMGLAPSGDFLFVADYGGVVIGYPQPAAQNYVHRLELGTGQWVAKKSYTAYHLQAVSDNEILLKSIDQFVTFTNNLWSAATDSLITINQADNSYLAPGYDCSCYSGDFRADVVRGRVIHGNSSQNPHTLSAFRYDTGYFVPMENTSYGSALATGDSLALALDGSVYYSGSLQVDAGDVRHNLRTFPTAIVAATGDIAFGSNGSFYDAHTGDLLGSLGYASSVYALNRNGREFWAYDPGSNLLRHYRLFDDVFADSFEVGVP